MKTRTAKTVVKSNRINRQQIEALEPRLLLSGIGTGINKKSVKFEDASGNLVTVKLLHGVKGASFNISLDGSAVNFADIDSLTIHNGGSKATLAISVTEAKISSGKTLLYSNGISTVNHIYGDGTIGANGLKGISSLGAVLEDVSLAGVSIGSLAMSTGEAGIFDKAHGTNYSDVIDFGSITAANISNLSLSGVHGAAGVSNDFNGPINISGALGHITGADATLNGTLDANSVGGMNLLGIAGNVNVVNGVGDIFIGHGLTGSLTAESFGNVTIAGGNFTGQIQSIDGNIGNVTLVSNISQFSGKLLSSNSIGNLRAGSYSNADVEANGDILSITSTATAANPNSGISNSVFNAKDGGIGSVVSSDSITDSQFYAQDGNIGPVTVTQGGLSGDTLTALSVGNLTSNLDISNVNVHAISGSIGNIQSKAGGISGSVFDDATAIGNVDAALDITDSTFIATGSIGHINSQFGGISDDTITGDHIGDGIYALSANNDISGVYVTATAEGMDSILSKTGSISDDTFHSVNGSIGNVDANQDISGNTFVADGSIGNLTSHLGDISRDKVLAGSVGDISSFAGIHKVMVTTTNGGVGNISTQTVGIEDVTIDSQVGISSITVASSLHDGISDSVFTAETGSIGAVTSVARENGITGSTFLAHGNIDVVNGKGTTGSGINDTSITATTGDIAGVVGTSVSSGNGLDSVSAFAGGTISAITGSAAEGDGIVDSQFSGNTGLGDISGTTTSANTTLARKDNGDVNDIGYNGIRDSLFRSGASIGNVSASTFLAHANAIYGTATAGSGDTVGCGQDGGPGSNLKLSEVTYTGGTIFSALLGIGNFNIAKGDIRGVVAMAGYDIGSDMTWDGVNTGHDYTPPLGTTTNIGDITVSNGDIHSSAFTAGVVSTDNILGNADDAMNLDALGNNFSQIGAISAQNNGYLDNAVFEASTIVSLSAGHIGGTNVTVTGSLGPITIIGSFPGDAALANSAFRAGGNIGDILVKNISGVGGDGIYNSLFQAGYNNPTGESTIGTIEVDINGGGAFVANNTLGSYANAIDSVCFVATGGIGTITGDVNSPAGAPFAGSGIINSNVEADSNANGQGAIGDILGTTTSTVSGVGIGESLFRGAGFGSITGITATVHGDGISNSGFDSQNDIGAINVTGDIYNSIFVAGVNLGDNFANDFTKAGGDLTSDATVAGGLGYGGTGSAADLGGATGNIGAITLTQIGGVGGKITDTSIIAGLVNLGADNIQNLPNPALPDPNHDTYVAGSHTVGAIIAPGGIDPSFITGGSIGTTMVSNGQISGTVYVASDANGTGIGDINVTYTLPGSPNDQLQETITPQVILDNPLDGAINSSSFDSLASIGNVSATLNGVRTHDLTDYVAIGGYDGLGVQFNAGTSIGNIIAINNTTGTTQNNEFGVYGMAFVTANAGLLGGAGGIGTIEAHVNTTDNLDGSPIYASTFDASAGNGSGDIAGITLSDSRPGGRDIVNAYFKANGNVGAINTTGTGFESSYVIAGGSFGDITIDGNVNNSKFLAGYNLGTDRTFGNTGDSINGSQTIGHVSVTGTFTSSDLIASVDPGIGSGDYTWGNSNDSSIGNGTIASVNLQTASTFNGAVLDGNNEGFIDASHGIEAQYINGPSYLTYVGSQATVVNSGALDGQIIDWANNGVTSEDVRVISF